MKSSERIFWGKRIAVLVVLTASFSVQSLEARNLASGSSPIDKERALMNLLAEPVQVVTASRLSESEVESPAVISVVSRERIRELGARTLPELLQAVPGFSPWRSVAGDWWPGVRGVFDSNRNIMVMIDGVSINNQFLSSPYWTWDLLDLRRFTRIEILRGPASAIYGPNAFLAVINCITDEYRPAGSEVQTVIGTDGTRGVGFSHTSRTSNYRIMLDLSGTGADGQSKFVSSDLYGRSGKTADRATRRDAMIKVTGPNGFTLLANHVEGHRQGYIGYYDVLNTETFFNRSNDQIALKYRFDCASAGSLLLSAHWNRFSDSDTMMTIPPGGVFPANNLTYPLGAFIDAHSQDTGKGARLLWSQPEGRRSRLSVEGSWERLSLDESGVYGSYATPNDPGTRAFLAGAYPNPETFRNTSFNLQEDLRLHSRSRLVFGGRFDDHSLFGKTFSPRLGYIRHLNRLWTGKFLYGQAFRNPDFYELTSNRNLQRERIETSEFQLSGELPKHWLVKGSLFHSKINDRIASGRLITQIQNMGETGFNGLEFNWKKPFLGGQEFFGNFSSIQKAWETDSPVLAPGVPRNRLNVGYTFPARPWSLCLWGTFTSDQERNADDPRDPLTGLRLLHLTVRRDDLVEGKGRLSLRIHNLLNTSWAYVTPFMPGEDRFPQPGREIELEYSQLL